MPDGRSAPCRVDPDEQWGRDPRLASSQSRIDQREWFWPALQDRLGRVKKAELMALAEKAGIPWLGIQTSMK